MKEKKFTVLFNFKREAVKIVLFSFTKAQPSFKIQCREDETKIDLNNNRALIS